MNTRLNQIVSGQVAKLQTVDIYGNDFHVMALGTEDRRECVALCIKKAQEYLSGEKDELSKIPPDSNVSMPLADVQNGDRAAQALGFVTPENLWDQKVNSVAMSYFGSFSLACSIVDETGKRLADGTTEMSALALAIDRDADLETRIGKALDGTPEKEDEVKEPAHSGPLLSSTNSVGTQ